MFTIAYRFNIFAFSELLLDIMQARALFLIASEPSWWGVALRFQPPAASVSSRLRKRLIWRRCNVG